MAEMCIVRGRVWNFPVVVFYILQHLLNPLAIVFNSEIFVLKLDNKPVSFCCVMKFGRIVYAGPSYTLPQYRKKGHVKRVLKNILQFYPSIYILTYGPFIKAALRYGFKVVDKPPVILRLQLWIANWVKGWFKGNYAVLRKG